MSNSTLPTLLVLGLLLAGCDQEPTTHTAEVPAAAGATPATSPAGSASLSTLDLTLPFAGATSIYDLQTAFWVNHKGTHEAGLFVASNTSNLWPALAGLHYGNAVAVQGTNAKNGSAGSFYNSSTANTHPALMATTRGIGTTLLVNHTGYGGSLATFQSGSVNKARIDKTGKGYFNGGTRNSGADVAEAFEVEGSRTSYQPGDVLVISTRGHRRVEKSAEPYSTRVVGVHATKPGVLLTERDIETSLDDMVPLGVIGVIPTKVSGENGAIHPGDLLVTAGTPGHAMAADPERLHFGMVLGKALEDFPGPGTGTIRVLVNVK